MPLLPFYKSLLGRFNRQMRTPRTDVLNPVAITAQNLVAFRVMPLLEPTPQHITTLSVWMFASRVNVVHIENHNIGYPTAETATPIGLNRCRPEFSSQFLSVFIKAFTVLLVIAMCTPQQFSLISLIVSLLPGFSVHHDPSSLMWITE